MVRLGVIGFGMQGRLYANILTGTPRPDGTVFPVPKDCVLTAVSARNERDRACVEALPNVRYFADWRELVASDVCDAVVITVPHFSHHEIAAEALRAGKHVLCEKPMTIRASDGREILRARESSPQCKAAMMLNQRANPLLQQLKTLVDSGELGTLRNSYYMTNRWWRPDNYYAGNLWRGTWAGEGGGILVNQACHPLDLWIWLCGMPSAVYAICGEGLHRNIAVENDVMVLAKYPNGASGCFTACSHDLMGTERLELAFDRGKIVLEENRRATVLRYERSEQEFGEQYDFRSLEGLLAREPNKVYSREELTAENAFAHDYIRMFENFAGQILRDEPPIASADEGLEQVELANAIQLSGWTGREIALPCDSEEYNRWLEEKIRQEKN